MDDGTLQRVCTHAAERLIAVYEIYCLPLDTLCYRILKSETKIIYIFTLLCLLFSLTRIHTHYFSIYI